LLDRDLSAPRVMAKLSEIDAKVQEAHDHHRQVLPARNRRVGREALAASSSRAVGGSIGAAPSFRFEGYIVDQGSERWGKRLGCVVKVRDAVKNSRCVSRCTYIIPRQSREMDQARMDGYSLAHPKVRANSAVSCQYQCCRFNGVSHNSCHFLVAKR
jgi:hypothetical protein